MLFEDGALNSITLAGRRGFTGLPTRDLAFAFLFFLFALFLGLAVGILAAWAGAGVAFTTGVPSALVWLLLTLVVVVVVQDLTPVHWVVVVVVVVVVSFEPSGLVFSTIS